MSLYHEAAEVLDTAKSHGGSLKSLIFGRKSWKNEPKTLFALATEAAKWSEVLSSVIDQSGVLKAEKNLSPALALLLAHDLLLSKKGIALPATHGLYLAISRHRARLSAELTKARLRRGLLSLEAFREQINAERAPVGESGYRHPRWVRVNTLRTNLDAELRSTFAGYEQVGNLDEITRASAGAGTRLVFVDGHVPNLIAVLTQDDLTLSPAYKDGRIVLQDKASCFPAYLLCCSGGRPSGDVVDACAAPGNKTTHLAALLQEGVAGKVGSQSRIIACEKDAARAKTLVTMIKIACADRSVSPRAAQDFLRLDPTGDEFANVSALLLDPSCSGSGIIGRDDGAIRIQLPSPTQDAVAPGAKKRKRTGGSTSQSSRSVDALSEEVPDAETDDAGKLKLRLENLSTFQQRLLQHAMAFSAATRISYSTCSAHAEENESVVVKALCSSIALQRGWRLLLREHQADGLRRWHLRGDEHAVETVLAGLALHAGELSPAEVADACIRCEKGGADGTMGFFVAGFVRDNGSAPDDPVVRRDMNGNQPDDMASEDEWNGFSDGES